MIRAESRVDRFGSMYFLVSVEENGEVIQKAVTVDNFKRILEKNMKEEARRYIAVPSLPPEVYKASISHKGEEDGFEVLLYQEPKDCPFSYMGKIMRLPFPALVFYLKSEGGVCVSKKVFAVRESSKGQLNQDTQLCYYPFGNVGNANNICMGNIKTSYRKIEESVAFIDSFLCGATNGDLHSADTNSLGLKQGDLVAKIEKEESFPNIFLKECKGKLGDFIK